MIAKHSKRIPSLRLHRPTGQALVELNGRRIYLGKFDLPATEQRYHRTIAEWLANGRQLSVASEEITVSELAARYLDHAEAYYVKPDGTPTSAQHRIKMAIKALRKLYGRTPAAEFGPKALRAVRQIWIDRGLSRKTINDYTNEIKHLLKWAASRELIPGSVYHALTTVEGLRRGRSEARETEPVRPVPQAHIDEVRKHVSRQVRALIQLQFLTGARSGELVRLRPIDIDTTGKVWTARIEDHKTAHRGRERLIYFGPQAQAIVRKFLAGRALDAYLFSPREAERERAATAPTHRRHGQPDASRKTDRVVGQHYTTASYRRAIERACRVAGVPAWTPHQLRHNAATHVRKEFGVEAAQLLLGHARVDVTQLYAEVNQAKAVEVALEIG